MSKLLNIRRYDYEWALELREQTVTHRRWMHRNAEVGLHMPKGQNCVMDQLSVYGRAAHAGRKRRNHDVLCGWFSDHDSWSERPRRVPTQFH